MKDIEKTRHFSKEALLIDGLVEYIPTDAVLIEPFYGNGDLAKNSNRSFSEYYDLLFKEGEHYRDTLKNPPDYKNKWVITNPPYLAKNKAKDKSYFVNSKYDDLYKIAISTLLESEGGILIIPINFFADERSKNIRQVFFKNFVIKRLNIYLDSMFDNTDYNVCSFFFERGTLKNISIPTYIYENSAITNTVINLKQEFDYRLGGDFFNLLKSNKPLFSRITINKPQNATNISVVCIDKTNEPLHFYYTEEPYFGKDSDRNIATLSYNGVLTEEQQKKIIEKSNEIISSFRKETYNLCLTNYRDRNRKRIGFTEAYQVATLALSQTINAVPAQQT